MIIISTKRKSKYHIFLASRMSSAMIPMQSPLEFESFSYYSHMIYFLASVPMFHADLWSLYVTPSFIFTWIRTFVMDLPQADVYRVRTLYDFILDCPMQEVRATSASLWSDAEAGAKPAAAAASVARQQSIRHPMTTRQRAAVASKRLSRRQHLVGAIPTRPAIST